MTTTRRNEATTNGVRILLGNPRKAIIKLALPMIVAMSIQTLYNIVDALWVAGLGPDALAAVGFFFPFFFLVMAFATGLGVGSSSAVSRMIGAHNKEGADSVAAHACVIMAVISIVITLPFVFSIEVIFKSMGAGTVAHVASSYARIMFGGTIIIFFSNVSSALLRGEGDVKRAMYAMMLGAGLNIVLDPIFIYTLRLGVPGAAWATIISLFISALLLFYWTCIKKDTYIAITFRHFRLKSHIVKDILRVGIPSTIMQLTMAFSVLFLNMIVVKVGGTDGIAVYTTGWRVAMVAILPLLGMSTAVISVTGAAYGGRVYKKLEDAYNYALRIGVIIEVCIAAATYIFAPQIAALFTQTQEGARITHDLIVFCRVMFVFYPASAFGIASSALFQGIGKGTIALALTIIRTIVFATPTAYVLAILLDVGLPGVWWGIVTGNTLGALVAYLWARSTIHRLVRSTGRTDVRAEVSPTQAR
ncbi:MATE family efflux transporter [candidate division WOR_3 bacterium SM23_60]|uniref:MATE family efflux transporter n=1 Tax=candidate division WOR_3 bacterium SM23_60 TaxID=1703780 RepID=A0A0S8GHN0_UNCW3|nr:MAG: MATE family efflux transporter [candidate division WOR_3 bacterium SM23_60]